MTMFPDEELVNPVEAERRQKEDEELLAFALEARKKSSRLMELATEKELARRAALVAKDS